MLGEGISAKGGGSLAGLARMLDESWLLPPMTIKLAVFDAGDEGKHNHGLKHSAQPIPRGSLRESAGRSHPASATSRSRAGSFTISDL